MVHEAGASVLRIAPSEFWKFSAVLFDHQTEYFDVNVVNETRNDTYRRLSRLAATVGIDEAKIYNLLAVPDKADAHGGLNIGNEVTDDVKYMVKVGCPILSANFIG